MKAIFVAAVLAGGNWSLMPGQALRASQEETVWLPDGKTDSHTIQLTRGANGTLAVHPVHIAGDRMDHSGATYFYLLDLQEGFFYTGDTHVGLAYRTLLPYDEAAKAYSLDDIKRQYVENQFGDCSVLTRAQGKAAQTDKVFGYDVVLVEAVENKERRTAWLAPDLGCFPLRREVRDGEEELSVRAETTSVEILPSQTRVALPTGIRLVSPKAYCAQYKAVYGVDFLPAKSCAALEAQYGRYAPSRAAR